MKKDPIAIIICIVLAVGILGTGFSVYLFIAGGKADSVVADVDRGARRAIVTLEYYDSGKDYTIRQNYRRNKKISTGDKVKVYYLKSSPDKAYTFNDLAMFFVIDIIFVPFAFLYFGTDVMSRKK